MLISFNNEKKIINYKHFFCWLYRLYSFFRPILKLFSIVVNNNNNLYHFSASQLLSALKNGFMTLKFSIHIYILLYNKKLCQKRFAAGYVLSVISRVSFYCRRTALVCIMYGRQKTILL